MRKLLHRAGMTLFIATAVNDIGHWKNFDTLLRDLFPTNLHRDDSLIKPAGDQENPSARVFRAFK